MKKFKSNIKESRIENQESIFSSCTLKLALSFLLCLYSVFSFGQVTSSVETNSIKIGEQITYKIQVEADTTKLVVFPEGQTFSPLEMIEAYQIDTTKNKDKYNLIRRYGLTQFDSGSYTIPKQKIIIGNKTFFTDSLQVEVHDIVVDSTKGLYDIKPIIAVEKTGSNWWKYVLYALLIIGAIAFLMYWFIWRKKPLTEEEQIALLPPYDRAKLALRKLDDSHYLEHENLKDYYSELTFIIRKYLDEKVYDHALESTTDELINRLNILKEGNQVDLSKEDIKNLESILKRADLVKFAKSAPDIELAKIDRDTIDVEIDHVKEALPEPTEEEKLLDEKYREEQARKKKRNKIIITVVLSLFLITATVVGFSIKYGFDFVKDTVIGHDSKELLEGEWVTSAYGFPPITITTPKVLKRDLDKTSTEKADITSFYYGSMLDFFVIDITTYKSKQKVEKKNISLKQGEEQALKGLEKSGGTNIVVKNEKFTTPNGAEGLKTFGTTRLPVQNTDESQIGEYVMLHFAADNILHRISMIWKQDDVYATQMVERILNSIELKEAEE